MFEYYLNVFYTLYGLIISMLGVRDVLLQICNPSWMIVLCFILTHSDLLALEYVDFSKDHSGKL